MPRGSMTYRAELRRGSSTTDAWNRPTKQTFAEMTSLGTVPLSFYEKARGENTLVLSDDKTARKDRLFARFPLSLDIKTEDRLGDITDRLNTIIQRGPFVVRQPHRRRRYILAEIEGHGVGS